MAEEASESHQLKPNFRTCGRSMSEGALKKGPTKDPRTMKAEGVTSVKSIPSKLETVLFSGNRERLGFGGQSLRFDNAAVEVPGPGQYKLPKDSLSEYTEKESWGKRGTGSFASKAQRLPRGIRNVGPAPGQYAPVQKEGLGLKSFAKTGSTPAFVPATSVNPQSFFEGPQPGPGHYNREEKWIQHQNPWKVSFTPGGERDALGGVSKDAVATPAPGEYRALSSITTEYGRNKNANFKSASSRKIVSVHPDMPIPERRDNLPERASDFVRECHGAVKLVTPGPGEYSQALQLQDSKDFCSLGSAAFVDSKLDRSSFLPNANTGAGPIGPGKYNPGNRGFWNNPCPTSMFKSSLDRMEERGVPPAPGPCFYEPKLVAPTKSFHLNIKRRFV
eukprot:gnl/MRDRNA2_/MRDRNA2_90934_c0_seq1.p1 gnl/MRDRNA2_/MRDRNA2_90934_c0~~gnl/MRDRNA2_/MRDRNA2_90934_c0_seq1.p1  ORF type:complete len:390 (+),score=67.71 gnl/MRDRNA2_/MRDRNA2_90934_c0_seq1:96-1265(+)